MERTIVSGGREPAAYQRSRERRNHGRATALLAVLDGLFVAGPATQIGLAAAMLAQDTP